MRSVSPAIANLGGMPGRVRKDEFGQFRPIAQQQDPGGQAHPSTLSAHAHPSTLSVHTIRPHHPSCAVCLRCPCTYILTPINNILSIYTYMYTS